MSTEAPRRTLTAVGRPEPLFRKVDSLQLPVPDLEAALAFYRDQLGHRVIWRSETAVGLRLPDTDAEIVIQTERPEIETDLLVDSADRAAERFQQAGGKLLVGPFDIQIGRCVVVEDPFGNRLVMLDISQGLLPSMEEDGQQAE